MEALLEKEGRVENWNDDWLDELSRRMDAGFERTATKAELGATREELKGRFDKVDHQLALVDNQLARINDRIDKLGYTILRIFGAFAATIAAAVIGKAVL